MTKPDVVVVGGGIAGSALATVLARKGIDVTVLERQRDYRDRVRGEYMAVWGVEEAVKLSLCEPLVEAGAHFAARSISFDETLPAAMALAGARDMTRILPGVPGPLCASHPLSCEALASTAASAGATVLRGATNVEVVPGRQPSVSFQLDGKSHQLSPKLIVGADGRTSTVRTQAGIRLQRSQSTHLVAGLLVDGVRDWPQDAYAIGTEGDRMFFVFPQGGERVRLYFCIAPEQRERFAGPAGTRHFLDDFRLVCIPNSDNLASARPIGPCATLTGEDTWTHEPFVDGVVLLGDAAGYNDPIIGQGLALAMRDVRVLSDLLVGANDWAPLSLRPYAEERSERMRRVRFTATVMTDIFCRFGPEYAQRRLRFFGKMRNRDPDAEMLLAAVHVGPDRLPAKAFTPELRDQVLN